jgi:hypothetical protein
VRHRREFTQADAVFDHALDGSIERAVAEAVGTTTDFDAIHFVIDLRGRNRRREGQAGQGNPSELSS